jgi:hypothetical protein
MRFKITGANAESGDDVDVMLEAPTRPDVEKIAHDRGILVESITVLESTHKAKDTEAIALVDEPAHANGNGAAHTHAAAPAPAAAHAAAPAPSSNGHAHSEPHTSTHMEYHVMMNQSLYLLESAVNRHLKEGWEPQGGVAIGASNNALQYFQALIRRPKT